jgi:hypothetical protein
MHEECWWPGALVDGHAEFSDDNVSYTTREEAANVGLAAKGSLPVVVGHRHAGRMIAFQAHLEAGNRWVFEPIP